ncbi:MAG: DUF2934 domain-containing protein [Candidatus Omnitrophica bacterium]|nr:DUF2934 domain-containing protein [Candidatus Omnitrophota bacterium]
MQSKKDKKEIENKKGFLESKMFYFDSDKVAQKDMQEFIKQRAYFLWKEAGMPEGKDMEIWIKAEKEGKEVFENVSNNEASAFSAGQKFPIEFAKGKLRQRIENLEKKIKIILERLSGLEQSKFVNDAVNDEREVLEKSQGPQLQQLMERITLLEEERISLLEEITTLQEQNMVSLENEKVNADISDKEESLRKENRALSEQNELLKKNHASLAAKINELEKTRNALFISKERENMEKEITSLRIEKAELFKKISELEISRQGLQCDKNKTDEQSKIISYLEKKSDNLEEELKAVRDKNHSLSSHIDLLNKKAKEIDDCTQNKVDWEKNSIITAKKIIQMEESQKELSAELIKLKTEKEQMVKDYAALKKLYNDSIKELEKYNSMKTQINGYHEERNKLFELIHKAEDEKKIIPYLDQKCTVLEGELRKAEREKNGLEKLLEKSDKERKELLEKIASLEQRSKNRLSLEQGNSEKERKIKELEENCKKLEKELVSFKLATTEEVKKSELDTFKNNKEVSEKEILELKKSKSDIVKENMLLKENVMVSSEKLCQMNEQISQLTNQITALRQNPNSEYVLDKEKLAELKEFTLEAIQSRKWKSAEFVNGAYDAVGLLFRAILADQLIIKTPSENKKI